MKHTKKLLAAVMALSMVSAVAPMSAFAITQDDIDPDTGKATGEMTATYDVTAKYTVTIPAGVTLDSTNAVSKKIEASDVMLESGQKINVTLDEASHTTNGTTFHAQNTAGDSTATYTINNGTKDIAVGDVVATFANNPDKTADPDVQTSTLTFSKAEGATYAGTHTETLTFGIEVENPEAPSSSEVFINGSVTEVKVNNPGGTTNIFAFTYDNGTFTPINPDGQNGYSYNMAYVSLTKDNDNLVLKTMAFPDGSIGSSIFEQYVRTYTFDTNNNTYTYTPPATETSNTENRRTFNSISVNGTEIPFTLES